MRCDCIHFTHMEGLQNGEKVMLPYCEHFNLFLDDKKQCPDPEQRKNPGELKTCSTEKPLIDQLKDAKNILFVMREEFDEKLEALYEVNKIIDRQIGIVDLLEKKMINFLDNE